MRTTYIFILLVRNIPIQLNDGSPAYWLPGPVFSAGKKYGQSLSTSWQKLLQGLIRSPFSQMGKIIEQAH